MLKELEQLSQKISRFIVLHEQSHQKYQDLTERYTVLSQELEQTQQAFLQLKKDYQSLQTERDILAQKIDDAQMKLNAIINQLPKPDHEEALLSSHRS